MESFKGVQGWLDWVKETATQKIIFILVGTKADLREGHEMDDSFVHPDTARAFAAEKEMEYFETSAKTGRNVEAAFIALVKKMSALKDAPPPPVMKMRKRGGTARLDGPLPPEEQARCC
jgi:GTPase SAR1 family protein